MSKQIPRIYEFGAFRLDEREGLLREGRTVPLPQKAFETLEPSRFADLQALSTCLF